MLNMQGTKKGQLTFVNIIGVLIGFLIYFTVFGPVYEPMANTWIASMDPTWQFYDMTVILIQVTPLILIIALVIQILNYAQPQYG